MIIHHKQFKIYFGDKADGITTDYYRGLNESDLLLLPPFAHIKKSMSVDKLMFADQVHGINGVLLTPSSFEHINAFRFESDYLTTAHTGIGIGVMSADCLPIIILDHAHNACSIVHAGWRGSAQRIAVAALKKMVTTYQTQAENVDIFFGPAAGSCCYQVQPDFKNEIEQKYHDLVFSMHDDALFFDNGMYNKIQLIESGVPASHINTEHNVCTLCNKNFCSYRRDKNNARQMSIVSITR